MVGVVVNGEDGALRFGIKYWKSRRQRQGKGRPLMQHSKHQLKGEEQVNFGLSLPQKGTPRILPASELVVRQVTSSRKAIGITP
jgi:hypothetical protein